MDKCNHFLGIRKWHFCYCVCVNFSNRVEGFGSFTYFGIELPFLSNYKGLANLPSL